MSSISRLLYEIQALQFCDKKTAEQRLLELCAHTGLEQISTLKLCPRPQSLNSMNGYITLADGRRYFFKVHTEGEPIQEDEEKSKLLEDAGYPVLMPELVQTCAGAEVSLYEIIALPTLFEVIKEQEDVHIERPERQAIVQAQTDLDERVMSVYEKTLLPAKAASTAEAPVHQLFSKRLSAGMRIDQFYRDKTFVINKKILSFAHLASCRWEINGVKYQETLAELIDRARTALDPTRPSASVIGHGDAHNGNVYYDAQNKSCLLFDPSFAGRHSPLLDLAKPLFHNVFAQWMYFPAEVDAGITLDCTIDDLCIRVEHSFLPSELRRKLLEIKKQRLLHPLLDCLDRTECKDDKWREYLRSALLCCSLLTVDLSADSRSAQKYAPAIQLLGLSMCVEASGTARAGHNPLEELFSAIFE